MNDIENWHGTYKLNEDKTCSPCSSDEWAEQREEMAKNNSKHVASDTVNGKWISTVWLGLNHQWQDGEPPLIFETMVFESGDFHDIYCDRYSTWQEAEEGHKRAVQWVKDGCKDDR